MQTNELIRDVTELLKRATDETCSIALAGAHAKGLADDESDIDFYLVVDDAAPSEALRNVITQAADSHASVYISDNFDSAPYGGNIDFRYRGVPIEVTVHTAARLRQRVDECLRGEFEIIPQTWTSNGYYTFIYLSELHFIQPLYDPNGLIAGYQNQLAQYPEPLRQAIIECFMGRANTWLDNFHYDTAITRADILFTAPIVLHTILDMVQVVFALNRQYFTGDKKLAQALAKLPACPAALLDNLDFLLCVSSDVNALHRQRELLREIYYELMMKINNQEEISC
ncbi:MAG: DUF4037 domain-containing protein [Oscillospiraceae bacterium]|nr:DUF4037 domain-containing protein [Oscillospiraceae bacterium]